MVRILRRAQMGNPSRDESHNFLYPTGRRIENRFQDYSLSLKKPGHNKALRFPYSQSGLGLGAYNQSSAFSAHAKATLCTVQLKDSFNVRTWAND